MAVETREWVFPGSDEFFRSIDTRAGIGVAETLAVCSAIAGEGKTTVSIGLAVTIAQDFPERRVLLVETDFRQPVLAGDFGVDASPGFADCLLNDQPINSAYRATLLDNLCLLPAGGPVERPTRLLRSTRMVAALAAIRQDHDLVILDVPAILGSSDALFLSNLADAAEFGVRGGGTPP